MADVCPISGDQVDERAGRIAAFISLMGVLLFTWRGWPWPMLALSLDFGLRALGWRRFSPVAQASRGLRILSGLDAQMINAGPKRFAALVGALFTFGISACLLFQLHALGLTLTVILAVCAALEAFLGFCVGCRVYRWLPFSRS